jgi:hypothetical protein
MELVKIGTKLGKILNLVTCLYYSKKSSMSALKNYRYSFILSSTIMPHGSNFEPVTGM